MPSLSFGDRSLESSRSQALLSESTHERHRWLADAVSRSALYGPRCMHDRSSRCRTDEARVFTLLD